LNLGKRNVNKVSSNKSTIKPRRAKHYLHLRPARVYKKLGISHKIPISKFDFSRDKYIELTQDLKQQIMSCYQASNRKLEDTIGIELSQYGYCD